jgi:serpin B
MRVTAMPVEPEKPVEVKVDRPFLFAIQHRASGACLFIGRVTDPR